MRKRHSGDHSEGRGRVRGYAQVIAAPDRVAGDSQMGQGIRFSRGAESRLGYRSQPLATSRCAVGAPGLYRSRRTLRVPTARWQVLGIGTDIIHRTRSRPLGSAAHPRCRALERGQQRMLPTVRPSSVRAS